MRRRTFTAGTAALGLVGAGCDRFKQRKHYGGEILGPSLELGHKIRDMQLPQPTTFDDVDVIIVGGGIAGLSAAWRFEGQGFKKYLLLELESQVGGTSRSGGNGICPYPWGAHYVPAPNRENRALVRILQEVGAVESFTEHGDPVFAEQALVRAPEERIFAAGQWWEGLYLRAGMTKEDDRQYKLFFAEVDVWVVWRDAQGRRAFTIPRSKCSDAPEPQALDHQSFKQWLDNKGFTSERLLWLLDYACRDDYGTRLESTSAWAGLFYFAARKLNPGEESRPIITWPEGNGALVNHLKKACQDRIRTGIAVSQILCISPGAIQVSGFDSKKSTALGWKAKRVIFAGPQHLAQHVIPTLWTERPEGGSPFHVAPWLVANISLRERPKEAGMPLAWDNVLREGAGLGYVVATHQTYRDHGPTVWTYYYPFTDPDDRAERKRLQDMDWQTCTNLVLDDLRKAHPDLDRFVARVDIIKWGHAMIQPRPHFLFSEALRRAKEPHQGIHFAHTDLSGLALFEEAQDHGLRAAEEILDGFGIVSPSWR